MQQMYPEVPFSKIVYVMYLTILGAFAKFSKATISFVMPVLPSVRMEQLGCHWKNLMKFEV
jgi:hypothetical protein